GTTTGLVASQLAPLPVRLRVQHNIEGRGEMAENRMEFSSFVTTLLTKEDTDIFRGRPGAGSDGKRSRSGRTGMDGAMSAPCGGPKLRFPANPALPASISPDCSPL